MTPYILVFAVAVLNILSITFFKFGTAQAGGITTNDLINPISVLAKVLSTPLLMLGIATSVCTTVLWLATLTRLPASVATPLMNSVFYVILILVSTLFLGETLSVQKVWAIGLLIVGGYLLISS